MNRSSWPHKWFGLWRESGARFESYPSILDFVDETLDSIVRKRLVEYLKESPVLVPGDRGTCIFDGEFCFTAKDGDPAIRKHKQIRRDGTWGWYPDLAHYVEFHNVVPPDAMIAHIADEGFVPPSGEATSYPKIRYPTYKLYYETQSMDALVLGNSREPIVLNPENVLKRFEECRALAVAHYNAGEMGTANNYFASVWHLLGSEEKEMAELAQQACLRACIEYFSAREESQLS